MVQLKSIKARIRRQMLTEKDYVQHLIHEIVFNKHMVNKLYETKCNRIVARFETKTVSQDIEKYNANLSRLHDELSVALKDKKIKNEFMTLKLQGKANIDML